MSFKFPGANTISVRANPRTAVTFLKKVIHMNFALATGRDAVTKATNAIGEYLC
jgi:hypothetical protein